MAASPDYTSLSSTSLTEIDPLILNRQGTSFGHYGGSNTSSPSSSSSRSSSIFSRGVICILMTVLFLELADFGIKINLVKFATDESQLNLTTFQALLLHYILYGIFCLNLVFGGLLADSVAGAPLVIRSGVIIYLTGALLLPVGAISKSDKYIKCPTLTNTIFKRIFFITGQILTAFGYGLYRGNIYAFVADQLSNHDVEATQSIFIWLYWFVNLGIFLALPSVVYVQQEISYFYGYLITTVCILLSLIVFLTGKRTYQIRPPTDRANLAIVKEAIQKLFRPVLGSRLAPHWLDRAKTCFGGSHTSWEVEYVKKVFRLLPIFATFILYFAIYHQMDRSMAYQGQHMERNLGRSFQHLARWDSFFGTIFVLVLLPVMDKLVYPLLKKCNINLSQLQRIGIGMISMTVSSVCAGGIELYRVDNCCITVAGGSNNHTKGSSISIFYQVPQYVLMSFSELFTIVTGLEVAYSEEAETIQSVVMGCFFLTWVLGFFFGDAVGGLVNLISGASSEKDKWYPEEAYINQGKLAYYFFLLAGLTIVTLILYVRVAISFQAERNARRRATYRNQDLERTSNI